MDEKGFKVNIINISPPKSKKYHKQSELRGVGGEGAHPPPPPITHKIICKGKIKWFAQKNVKIYLNQKYKLKLGWADVAQTQYCRNVRENLIKKTKNLLKSLRKCSLKISTNCRIKEKIGS